MAEVVSYAKSMALTRFREAGHSSGLVLVLETCSEYIYLYYRT